MVLNLMSVSETDKYIRDRLAEMERLWNADEDQLPLCSDEDLWRSEPQFKYYKGGDSTAARSTKNFDTIGEANTYRALKGVGIVVEKPGKAKACHYCQAFPLCSQKDGLIAAGDLTL